MSIPADVFFQKVNAGVAKIGKPLLLAAGLGIAGASGALRGATSPPPAATSIAQLYSLPKSRLAEHLRFEVTGTVLSYDADWQQLFLQNDEAVFYLTPGKNFPPLRPGDLLKVSGLTAPLVGQLPLTNVSVARLGSAPLPASAPLDLKAFPIESHWVEGSVPVRSAETSRGRLLLTLGDGTFPCVAYVMGPLTTNDCKALIGATIQLRGVTTCRVVNGRAAAGSLVVPDWSFVSVVTPALTPVQTLPVVSIDGLLNRPLGPWIHELVHLNGAVVSQVPGESLFIGDATGSLRAQVSQLNAVKPGQRVDVWGYLDAEAETPLLRDAYFEPIPAGKVAAAAPALPLAAAVTPRMISNIAQLRALPAAELAQAPMVKFQGVVIYGDPEWQTAFVRDAATAVYVQLSQSNISLGDVVEVAGRATFGTFGPAIFPAEFRRLGTTNLPQALKTELAEVADANQDAQWVEMTGVVRSVSAAWGHLYLSLMTRQGKFEVVVPGFAGTNPPAYLLGSQVAVTGVCGSDPNPRRQLSGITLYTPTLAQVKVLEPAASEPFAVSPTTIGSVATFDPERMSGGRVKVTGIVTLAAPGLGLFIQDGSGGIRVDCGLDQSARFRPGDVVEALGFPALGDFSPHLEQALVRRVGGGKLPAAAAVTAERILLEGGQDGILVRLEAHLLQPVPHSAQPKLIVQQGPVVFSAQLAQGHFPGHVSGWRPGTLLRLTGICSIQGSAEHTPQSFHLLLGGPAAVEVLYVPPAWTAQDWLVLLGTVGLVGLLALGWITALRRQVRIRTADLHASKVSLQEQLEHNRALSELGRRLNAAVTPKEAALIIVDVADRLLGWDSCLCTLYCAETAQLHVLLSMDEVDGNRVDCHPKVNPMPLSGVARTAVEQGPQLILRTAAELEKPQSVDTVPFGNTDRLSASLLYVPIRKGPSIVGLLSIQSYKPNAYTQQDLDTLQALAEHCSGALERQRASQEIQRANRLYSVLSKINELIVRAQSVEALCQQACRVLVEDGLFRLAWFGVLEPATRLVRPVASAGVEDGYLAQLTCSADPTSPFSKGPVGQALLKGVVSVCNDIEQDPNWEPWREAAQKRGYAAVAAFPIKTGPCTVGVLALYSLEPGFFNKTELELLERLSTDLSFATQFLAQGAQLQVQAAALSAAENSITITDPDGVILWLNSAFCVLTGFSSGEVLGRKLSILRSGQHPAEFYRQMWQTITNGQPWHGEIINSRKDGTRFSSDLMITPVQDVRGRITHYIAIQHDITRKKADEARLQAFATLGKRLNTVNSSRAAAQLIVEVADQLLGWDACFFELYSPADRMVSDLLMMDVIDGRRTEIACEPAYHPPSSLPMRALEQGGVLLLRDQPGLRSDGVPFGDTTRASASILFVPIRNGEEATGVLSIQSYTPKAYDQDSLDTLQALADHCGGALARIAAQENLRQTQEQLRQAQRLEAIGQLAGGVAHDFNNLLAVIRGNADLALMESASLAPRARDCLRQVTAASERAANLTQQLLIFGRKRVMQFRPVDLNELVGNLTKMLMRTIGEHISFHCDYASQPPFVQADPSMLEQILLNLVVNARDAMTAGGRLTISTDLARVEAESLHRHPESRPGLFGTLRVQDSGTGIAPEVLPRIFEPFFTTKEVGKGTGLGLSTVYGIAKQHNGWVEVTSQVAVGSIFTVFLPALERPEPAADRTVAEAAPARGREHILLVEDDKGVRSLTRAVLEKFGYHVTEADSGIEALERFAGAKGFDLLLTDMIMPGGLNGRELADKLREQNPTLKVLFTSGYSGDALGQDTVLFHRPGTHFLPKPASPRQMLEAIRRCLDEGELAPVAQ